MPPSISRRQFLRGDIRDRRTGIRPPWSLPGTRFEENCTRCGECIVRCPENILTVAEGGFPHVDFSRGECTFCGDCVRSCTAGAFHKDDLNTASPWSIKASIKESCLALRMVVCGVCAEYCDTGAIKLRMRIGGVSVPRIDAEVCNGCGACFSVCPEQAISMKPIETSEGVE